MILIILGLILFLAGWKITKTLLFPIFFLLFMFPIPSAYYVMITNPLKLLITEVSVYLIDFFGVPVYREGNLLFLASIQLEVAEACSGVRSLYSYLMLGFMFSTMTTKKNGTIIVLSTLPLALAVNIARVSGTGIISHHFGPTIAQGFFHEFTGFLLFAIGIVFLGLEYRLLKSLYK
jgi:exosortase